MTIYLFRSLFVTVVEMTFDIYKISMRYKLYQRASYVELSNPEIIWLIYRITN